MTTNRRNTAGTHFRFDRWPSASDCSLFGQNPEIYPRDPASPGYPKSPNPRFRSRSGTRHTASSSRSVSNSTAEEYRIPTKQMVSERFRRLVTMSRSDLEYPQRVVSALEELTESRLVPTSDVLVDRFQSFDCTGKGAGLHNTNQCLA